MPNPHLYNEEDLQHFTPAYQAALRLAAKQLKGKPAGPGTQLSVALSILYNPEHGKVRRV